MQRFSVPAPRISLVDPMGWYEDFAAMAAAPPSRLATNAAGSPGRPYAHVDLGAVAARCKPRPPRRPCHERAIHSGPDRSRADNHGQHHRSLDLRRSPLPESEVARTGFASRRRPRPDGTGPSVRPGSVAHRDYRGTNGHQRSPRVKRRCGSTGLRLIQLKQRQTADQIVVPTLHPEIGERCRPVIDDLCHHAI
jgi:hypothetical protein